MTQFIALPTEGLLHFVFVSGVSVGLVIAAFLYLTLTGQPK